MKQRRVEELRADIDPQGDIGHKRSRRRRDKKVEGQVFALWRMLGKKGITRRWLSNYFIMIFLLLTVMGVAFFTIGRNYYYNSIEQGLIQRSSVTIRYFGSTLGEGLNSGNSEGFLNAAQSFVEGFEGRDKMELQILNAWGEIIVSSTGFSKENDTDLRDYNAAVQSGGGVGIWAGKNRNGENVLAVTRLISPKDASGGAVRFVVSLTGVNRLIIGSTVSVAALILVVMIIILLSGNYFINSIVIPVTEITASANKIAKGDFDIRLQTPHDDEIGSLVGAINSMAAELAANEKMKNDFISTVSHELRTPLTAIKGWGETIKSCGPDDRALMEKGMGIILRESDRLNGLVEDLLDFSRIQNGNFKMDYSRVDVNAEVADTVYMFTERCLAENKTISFSQGEGIPQVIGDRDRLRQVFINIIDNAVKYSDDGGVIEVATVPEGDWVKIVLRDNGCGISQRDLGRVAKRFYKANKTRSGFGIGLAVVDEIVRQHQGSLSIDSVEGKGTTVTVSLPSAARFKETNMQ